LVPSKERDSEVEMMDNSGLIGKTVKEIRIMTEVELRSEGWDDRNCTVIVFDDGTLLYPSRDEEGNGPGQFFGITSKGECFHIWGNKNESTN
jgi:hypothetical protein